MTKLLHASLSRMKRDLSFWLCAGFMCAAGVFVALKTGAEFPLDRTLFSYALILGLALSVFAGLFLGTEYGDGTLRNKLIVGHSRAAVYVSNMLVCVLAGICYCVAFLIPMLAIGIPRLQPMEMTLPSALALFGISAALAAAFAGIYTLIAMCCRSKAVAAVTCILCFLLLLCLGAAVNARLQEPENIDSYVTTMDGTSKMQSEPNPDYLSGTKREVYQMLLDILPGGQALQFVDLSMVKPWRLPVFSLLILILTTSLGCAVFRKKNVN